MMNGISKPSTYHNSAYHNHVAISYIPAPQMDVDRMMMKANKKKVKPKGTKVSIDECTYKILNRKEPHEFDNKDMPNEPYRKINPPETYFVLSSVVTVCFNLPIGMFALLCSWEAQKAFDRGEMKIGRRNAKWAFCLSMSSMVLTVCVVMAVVFYVAYVSASKH